MRDEAKKEIEKAQNEVKSAQDEAEKTKDEVTFRLKAQFHACAQALVREQLNL